MVINNYRQNYVKFDIKGIRVSTGEIIFYTGLILWLIQFYISRTIFLDLFGGTFLTAVRYFCMLIFAVKIVMGEKTLRMRAAAAFIIAAAVFVVVQQHVHTGMPLIQVLLLVFAARDVSFKRTCKVILWTCLVLWIIPILVDRLGIHQMEKDIYKNRVREFLNFSYVSYPSIYFINIVCCGMYAYTEPLKRGPGGRSAAQKTVTWPVIFLTLAVSIWLLEVTDTTFPFGLVILFIVLYVLAVKARMPLFKNTKRGRAAATAVFPVLGLLTYLMARNYNWRIPWMKKLDEFSHSRISLAFLGIRDYGVHLLGTQIKENTDKSAGSYFYVDSGYIKNLLNYGLIVFIMIILFYSVIMYAAMLENDKVLVIWLICIAIYSIFNNLLLSVTENGCLLAIWYALDLLKWHRKKKRFKRVLKREQLEHAA